MDEITKIADEPIDPKKRKRVTFWGTEELHELMKQAAQISGLTVSQIYRIAAKAEAKRILSKQR